MSDQLETDGVLIDLVKLEKAKKKRLKRLEEELETAVLTPWERYRALTDQLKQNTDIIELADRKTRFALVILAALNAVNFVFVARPDLLLGGPVQNGLWLAIYITLYAILSLFLCVQAIWALKPRLSNALQSIKDHTQSITESWLHLLSWDSIATQSPEQYYESWHRAQFGQLNREVALSVHSTSCIIIAKYGALKLLYAGLMLLVFLTACLVLSLTYLRLGL
jgi:hypothetical protein